MLPTFTGTISDGKISIVELGRASRFIEGKRVAVAVLETNKNNQVSGGSILAGTYKDGSITTLRGKEDLSKHNGKAVLVTIRQELLAPVGADAFDKRFQLGGKPNDLDN
jgi:hypothetical protein